jgi:hypothetical protein
MFTATDERDWDAVAAAFADRVALDYPSLSGGEWLPGLSGQCSGLCKGGAAGR